MRLRTMRYRLWPLLAVLWLVQAAPPGTAQEFLLNDGPGEVSAGDCKRAWSFRVIPFGWVPGMHGDVTVRGVTAPVDVSIGRVADIIVNEINFLAQGQVEASNGKVGVLFNGNYLNVAPGREVRRLDFSSHFAMTILDAAVTYQVDGLPERLGLPAGSRLELLAGARYVALSGGVTITGPRGNTATDDGSEDWVDPIVGGRLRVPLFGSLTAQVRGDVGGFDIGTASRFTWNVEATLEYRLSERCSLLAGYRWLDIDVTTHHGNQRFGFDMLLSGPIVGFALDF